MNSSSPSFVKLLAAVVAFSVLALAAGCAPNRTPPEDPSEPFATVTQSVEQGTVDTANQFSFVIQLQDQSNNNRFCSGTLINRWTVLAARHCFIATQGGQNVNSNLNILFGTTPAQVAATHTAAISGPVLVFSNDPISELDDDSVARDVAVVPLDAPVPYSITRPLHPPILPGDANCGDSPIATVVGYGDGENAISCAKKGNNFRRFASFQWDRSTEEEGSVFISSHDLDCGDYDGQSNGDSGGLLFGDNGTPQGTVCGVVSGTTFGPFNSFNKDAAVDSRATDDFPDGDTPFTTPFDFVSQNVLDGRGYFRGECPASYASPNNPLSQSDLDGDQILDICDNCRFVTNPAQDQPGGDDPDQNGFGSNCDLCPGVKDQSANGNFEYEIGFGYKDSGLTQVPPILASDANPLFEIVKMKAFIRPDACDKTPLPRQMEIDGKGSLPDADIPGPPVCSIAVVKCHWLISNQFRLSPAVPPIGAAAPGKPVATSTVGLRWCPCPLDTTAFQNRAICAQNAMNGCTYDIAEYTKAGSKWQHVVTTDFPQEEYALPTVALAQDNVFQEVDWNFREGTAAAYQQPTIDPATNQIIAYTMSGVLWTSTQSYTGGPISSKDARDFGNVYGPGNPYILFTGELPGAGIVAGSGPFQEGCPACGEDFTRIFARVGDPALYRVLPGGLDRVTQPNAPLRDLYDQITSGAVQYVEAGEPLGRVAQLMQPGEGFVRGVTLSGTTVGTYVLANAMDTLPIAAQRIGGTPRIGDIALVDPPIFQGNEGIVLSGHLRRLYVIGGTTNGKEEGPPNTSAWILDIDTNIWQMIKLPAAERLGAIVGSTFRIDDLGVYVVERRSGKLRIVRWDARHPFVTPLAELPEPYRHFDHQWLVAGAEGDLLFAATKDHGGGPKQSLFVRLTFGQKGALGFDGLGFHSGRTIAQPILGQTGISYVVPEPSGAHLITVALGELGPAPPGFLPTFD